MLVGGGKEKKGRGFGRVGKMKEGCFDVPPRIKP